MRKAVNRSVRYIVASSWVHKFRSSWVQQFMTSAVSTQFEWLFAAEVRTLIIGTVSQNWSAGVLEPLLHKPCTSACMHNESQWKVEQCNALHNKILLPCFIRKWTKYSISEVISLPCIMLLLLTYASIKDVLVQCYISPFPKGTWLGKDVRGKENAEQMPHQLRGAVASTVDSTIQLPLC